MAELSLIARPAFPDLAKANIDGLAVAEVSGLSIATVVGAHDEGAMLDVAMIAECGASLPLPGRRIISDRIELLSTGPDTWLAIVDGADGRDLERELKAKLGAAAAVTDASDSRAVLRVSGVKARAVLARGLPIDLHETVFKPDDVAITHAAHIGVTIWMLDDAPTYRLAISRSYADSFAQWLIEAAVSEAASPL